MNTKKEKILYAINNNPLLIGALIKDTSINKGFLYRLLKQAVPCRIGIEFELSGNFRKGFHNKYHKGILHKRNRLKMVCCSNKPDSFDTIMKKHYGVYEIVSDNVGDSYEDEELYEIRVSIKDFHQLKGLYTFMQDLPEFCKLHEGGGIHIHVDVSKYLDVSGRHNSKCSEVTKFIRHHLDEIQAIFPKYKGKYNYKRVGLMQKATWLNVSQKNTFEFRIAPLTFDYTTLIKWIIGCIQFRNKVIHKCNLKHSFISSRHNINNIGRIDSVDNYIDIAEDEPALNVCYLDTPTEPVALGNSTGTFSSIQNTISGLSTNNDNWAVASINESVGNTAIYQNIAEDTTLYRWSTV